MDTDVKIFKCDASQTSPEAILSSGETFSGSIRFKKDKNSWLVFDLVNKALMEYILSDINFNKGVKLEIFAYDENPKKIQYESNWDKINST